jgi:hypothetical protein
MTFAQLYGESLNRELGSDDTTQLFTTVRRKAAINEAQREFARVTECYTREATIPLVIGQMEYDLDCHALAQFHYIKAESGKVMIGLTPPPSTAGSLRVPYIAQPADMVLDADEPYQTAGDVRTSIRPWHVALAHYGASLLERYRKDSEAVERQLQRFSAYVTDYLQRWRRPPGDLIMFDRDYYGEVARRGGITIQGDPRV